jgi:pectin methylesterase-like acyl-CoA thioesterase
VARCFLRTNNDTNTIGEIIFDNCVIHDCGSGGWNFMYPKHIVKSVKVSNSTLCNYTNGESFFFANGKDQNNVFTFEFTNNTVYRWAKSNDRALCKTEGKYSTESTYTFANNIVWKGGSDNVKPQMIQATGGTLTARNNLVLDYGDYNCSGTKEIQDLTLEGLGLSCLPWPDADGGDFTIVSSSSLATASTTGGILGDPRWLKTVANAVSFEAVASPTAGGTVAPANATFDAGEQVSVTATANYGYRFQKWQDDKGVSLSTENPYIFTISEATRLTAVFSPVDTYNLTVNKAGDGAKWGEIRLSPEPVKGVYEAGTEVSVSVVPNSVTSFLYWENGSSEQSRLITMDEAKELTATFDVIPFVVAWSFNPSEPRGNRTGDYFFETDNTGTMLFFNGDGSQTSWGGSNRTFGGVALDCARRYTDADKMTNPRSFVAEFSVANYDRIRIHSLVAADNGCVHSGQLLQYSTVSATEGFTTLTTVTLKQQPSSEWIPMEYELDTKDMNGLIYIRWIGDATTPLLGEASGTEGFYLADVVIYGDKSAVEDYDAPVLLSSSPAAGSNNASARGQFILNFNERVKQGTGTVTLNGETLTGVFGSKTVTYAYKGLAYNTSYTLSIGENAIVDLSGNALPATGIEFTTMNRPEPAKRLFDAVVAQDGTGDFSTVQAAINAAPQGRTVPYLIFVKNGQYEELVKIPKTKPFIHLIGQDKEKTVIRFWVNNGGSNDVGYEYSTNNPASKAYGYQGVFQVDATDFYTENITFYNAFGVEKQSGPMGLAMRSTNDRQAFNNCQFRSYQDTWFTSTTNVSDRHYVNNCWIEGAVDYFYGAGDVYVENTTFCNVRNGSVIVAPCHKPGTKWGYVMQNCIVDAALEGVGGSHALGRPWHDSPITVWLNTTMKTGISPSGWNNMGAIPALFAEYNSVDANGDPMDLSHRRTEYTFTRDGATVTGSCRATITAEEAAAYTYESVLAGPGDDWNPRRFFEPVDAPQDLQFDAAANTISWSASPYSICYLIIDEEEKVVGFTKDTEFVIPENHTSTYLVLPVNEYGSLGAASEISVVTTAIQQLSSAQQTQDDCIYDLTGRKLPASKLQKGFCIFNGRKVSIR